MLGKWTAIICIVSVLGVAQAAEMNADILAGTFNGQSLCDLTVEKVREILGPASDVRLRNGGTQAYYFTQGMMFFFSREGAVGLSIYLAEAKSTEVEGTFKAYSGKSNKDINHTWKLERFLEEFPEYTADEDVKVDGKRVLLFKSKNTWAQVEVDPTSGAILKLTYSRANLWWK